MIWSLSDFLACTLPSPYPYYCALVTELQTHIRPLQCPSLDRWTHFFLVSPQIFSL